MAQLRTLIDTQSGILEGILVDTSPPAVSDSSRSAYAAPDLSALEADTNKEDDEEGSGSESDASRSSESGTEVISPVFNLYQNSLQNRQ